MDLQVGNTNIKPILSVFARKVDKLYSGLVIFSIGVAIFSAVNRYLAKIMNNYPQYDVTMQETHHIHKLDAPSGTANYFGRGYFNQIIARKTKVGKRKTSYS